MRYYDPCAGRVCVEGHDLKALCLRDWRMNVGFVSQEPVLFDDTLAANIKYGKPGMPRGSHRRDSKDCPSFVAAAIVVALFAGHRTDGARRLRDCWHAIARVRARARERVCVCGCVGVGAGAGVRHGIRWEWVFVLSDGVGGAQ